jgi:hypothetical protein
VDKITVLSADSLFKVEMDCNLKQKFWELNQLDLLYPRMTSQTQQALCLTGKKFCLTLKNNNPHCKEKQM